MQPVKNAVIAAAGVGSRLALGVPKCLLEVNKKTLLFGLLELLKDVENVFLVVGYMEDMLIKEAFSYRSDIIIVRNTEYNNNTTCDSYAMGAAACSKGNVLYMDADLIIDAESFKTFTDLCVYKNILVGMTSVKTKDAVYVHYEKGVIVGFSRTEKSAFEWCNVLYAPADFFDGENKWVYERISRELPQNAHEIACWEIDSQEDLTTYYQNCKLYADS